MVLTPRIRVKFPGLPLAHTAGDFRLYVHAGPIDYTYLAAGVLGPESVSETEIVLPSVTVDVPHMKPGSWDAEVTWEGAKADVFEVNGIAYGPDGGDFSRAGERPGERTADTHEKVGVAGSPVGTTRQLEVSRSALDRESPAACHFTCPLARSPKASSRL